MKYYTLILFFLMASIIVAQKYAGDFLYEEIGAKTKASGGAFFINQGDIAAMRYLAADYSYNTSAKVFSIVSSKFNGLIQQMHIGFSQPLLGGINITANWNYSGVTDIPKYNLLTFDGSDNTPNEKTPVGYSSYNNHIFSLSMGEIFDDEIDIGWDYFLLPYRLPVAINVNYIKSTLFDYKANAFTIDLSAAFTFNLGQLFMQTKGIGDFSYFMNMSNFAGSKLSWSEVSNINETNISFKNFEPLANNYSFGFNFVHTIEEENVQIGFAYQHQGYFKINNWGFLLSYDKLVEIRLGLYDAQFTMGLGGKYLGVEAFISLSPKHDLGKSLFIDLSYDL